MKETLLRRIKVDLNWNYLVGDYRPNPKLMICERGTPIDLEDSRREHLDDRQQNEIRFMNRFKKVLEAIDSPVKEIIEQMVIPIDCRNLWLETLLETNNLDKRLKGGKFLKDKAFFVLDLYIPSLSLAVELDYPSTHDKEADDARDAYLERTHGIRTLRIQRYYKTNSIEGDKRILEIISRMVESKKSVKFLNFDNTYSELIDHYFGSVIKYVESVMRGSISVRSLNLNNTEHDKLNYLIRLLSPETP